MTDLVSPLPYLADLAHLFTEGAAQGGLTIDAVLCRAFAEGVAEVGTIISSLVVIAEAGGRLEQVTLPLPPERCRTPVERRRLAAMAVPLDPARQVLAFPITPARAVAIAEGGSAA